MTGSDDLTVDPAEPGEDAPAGPAGSGEDALPDPSAPRTDENGGKPRRLDPRVRSYWWARGGIYSIVLGGGALAQDLGWLLPRLLPETWPPGLFGGIVLAVTVVLSIVIPPVAYERWRFALREEDLWIRRGILVRSVSVIPYRRLQFVDTQQGPVARLFGLAELVVHTAAPGTSGRVPGLDAGEAEVLRERLAHLEPTHDEPI
jgi:uncharacterized protein